jgi:hypothetical protein
MGPLPTNLPCLAKGRERLRLWAAGIVDVTLLAHTEEFTGQLSMTKTWAVGQGKCTSLRARMKAINWDVITIKIPRMMITMTQIASWESFCLRRP